MKGAIKHIPPYNLQDEIKTINETINETSTNKVQPNTDAIQKMYSVHDRWELISDIYYDASHLRDFPQFSGLENFRKVKWEYLGCSVYYTSQHNLILYVKMSHTSNFSPNVRICSNRVQGTSNASYNDTNQVALTPNFVTSHSSTTNAYSGSLFDLEFTLHNAIQRDSHYTQPHFEYLVRGPYNNYSVVMASGAYGYGAKISRLQFEMSNSSIYKFLKGRIRVTGVRY